MVDIDSTSWSAAGFVESIELTEKKQLRMIWSWESGEIVRKLYNGRRAMDTYYFVPYHE